MGEESSKPNDFYTKDTIISEKLSEAAASLVDLRFRRDSMVGPKFPTQHDAKDSFSELICGCLKVHSVLPGKISCILSVKPAISNVYQSMHGGAVGAVAERVSIACARTVVGKDKELFLGELSMSFVSAAPSNVEVVVDGSVIRSGRNLTIVAADFRLKDSGKLVYASNATFYHMPAASL
ncbi:PREDICTED: acyl-coenzyme A thioesterase 13-like [Nicotiana attenuata]|uniref:Thioesterase domain-containing protein n=1 Tax=Nicotiana attenuata TaxID=49451 RepID=A0A314KP86_NICAT|nr:PREDICTED: acyl-coenzyme A thioesterase 13-like [Nicotiana attenuata]OIT31062.1 hypothetical protein A4A49_13647 [Nicotiana attenuata]